MTTFDCDKDGIPKDPNAYRSQQFWESRYASNEHHEWLTVSRDDIIRWFVPIIKPCDRVLVLGCGTSSFSQDLSTECQCEVVSVDYAESAIQHMRSLQPSMQWLVMDICQLHFDDAHFDHVIDKATVDALFSDGSSPWSPSDKVKMDVSRALSEAYRVLKPGGWFVSVSLGQPHFRLPYFEQLKRWSKVERSPLGTFSHIYRLQKESTQ